MYYEASTPDTGTADGLDAMDVVADGAEPKEVFSYTPTAGADPVYTVETSRTIEDGNTDVTYMTVDTMAVAAPAARGSAAWQQVGVTADIPAAVKYSHIHFGVWAKLGDAKKDGSHTISDLGIGFVQSIGDGMTEKQGIGKATFNGDWVASIQKMSGGGLTSGSGSATLTADFGKDTVKGVLDGLATLDGTLSGNGFSGTKASAITHPDLKSTGTFEGSFSGGIYGADGSEAAGVFDFAGGDAGAFRGAFGGKDMAQ